MRQVLPRRAPRLVFLLALLLSIVPAALVPQPAAAQTELSTIWLVSLNDGGPVGCGDTLIPVTVEIASETTTEGKIKAALEKLFSLHDPYYGESGLYNALYENTLVVETVIIQNDTAGIFLSGSTGSRGVCDEPRIEGQITQTALEHGVSRVVIILNGGPLADYRGPTYFPETGHSIAMPFSLYWENNGGLPVFGYPLTDQLFEGGHRVQYFERQRFESHPENPEAYTIQLGLLGVEIARQTGLTRTASFQRQNPHGNPNCEYFPETGHHLCFGFRNYWHNHGLDMGDPGYSFRESLALFGYPISDEFIDPTTGLTMQYFERARFEWHPEYRGTQYEILLGRLGADLIE